MKTIMNNMTVIMLLMTIVSVSYSKTESVIVQLEGKSLFSFTQEHFIFQTDKYFYKISKKGLPAEKIKKFENATISNANIKMTISSHQINQVWPVATPGNSCCWSGISKTDYNSTVNELVTGITENSGKINLVGKLTLSFSEPYYLIQVNDEIFQINKSVLTKIQQDELNTKIFGSQVSLSIPKQAISYSWSFKQEVSRNIASADEEDEILLNKSFMNLKGTVLYSANEPVVIIQSKNMFYQIKRAGILMKNPQSLDVNGSKVQLIVPVKDIDFFWSTNKVRIVNGGLN